MFDDKSTGSCNYILYNKLNGKLLLQGTCDKSLLKHKISDNTIQDILLLDKPLLNTHYYVDSNLKIIPIPENIYSIYHIFDYDTKRWIDTRTLDEMKVSKWEEIKVSRTNSELSGFKFDGKVFNSTLSDQIKINGLLNTITINPTHTEKWYAQDNSYVLLAKENIALFSSKLTQHISYVYKVAGDLRIMINNCSSKKELDQLIWPL